MEDGEKGNQHQRNNEKDIGQLRTGRREEMGDKRTDKHKEHAHEHIKMLGLQGQHEQHEEAHGDKKTEELAYANLVLETAIPEMDGTCYRKYKHKNIEGNKGKVDIVKGRTRERQLSQLREMGHDRSKVLNIEEIEHGKPIGRQQPDERSYP